MFTCIGKSDLLEVISESWNEANEYSITIEQLLHEIDPVGDAAPETLAKINEVTLQYHAAMKRYKEASEGFKTALEATLD